MSASGRGRSKWTARQTRNGALTCTNENPHYTNKRHTTDCSADDRDRAPGQATTEENDRNRKGYYGRYEFPPASINVAPRAPAAVLILASGVVLRCLPWVRSQMGSPIKTVGQRALTVCRPPVISHRSYPSFQASRLQAGAPLPAGCRLTTTDTSITAPKYQ